MTKIYGASDDLIEIEGDISDEVGDYYNTRKTIKCSDGTAAKIEYDGNWRITVTENGSKFLKLVLGNPAEEPHTDPDCKNLSAYSDVLILDAGIEWVKIGGKTFKP